MSAGVIDIGSNSVRLEIFDEADGAPFSIYNEKELCALGRGLDETGMLNPDGVAQTLHILPRFMKILESAEVENPIILATAAVRDANGGADFVAAIEEITGQKVRLLSGEEEAFYSANGLSLSFPHAHGVMGDLGGGSVELVLMNHGQNSKNASFPLGPIRMPMKMIDKPQNAKNLIKSYIDGCSWLKPMKQADFYCIGGAWRNLAKLHMAWNDAPLYIIDHYTIPYDEAKTFLEKVASLSQDEIGKYDIVNKKRVETIAYAAYLLLLLIQKLKVKSVCFSAHGLREGIMSARKYQSDEGDDNNDIPPIAIQKETDPLILSAQKIRKSYIFPSHMNEGDLYQWLLPLIDHNLPENYDLQTLKRLVRTACILANYGREDHSDYRSNLASSRILHGPLLGISHEERYILATIISYRHGGKAKDNDELALMRDHPLLDISARIGLALRLAYALGLGHHELLQNCRFHIEEDKICFSVRAFDHIHNGEAISKRLDDIAKHMGLMAFIDVIA